MLASSKHLHRLMPPVFIPMELLSKICRTHCSTVIHHSNRTLPALYRKRISAQYLHTSSVLAAPRGQSAQFGNVRKQKRMGSSSVDNYLQSSMGELVISQEDAGITGTYIVDKKHNIVVAAETDKISSLPKKVSEHSTPSQDSLDVKEKKQHLVLTKVQEFPLNSKNNPSRARSNQIKRIGDKRNQNGDNQSTYKRNVRMGWEKREQWEDDDWFSQNMGDERESSRKVSSREMRITSPKISDAFQSSETSLFDSETTQIRPGKERNTNRWNRYGHENELHEQTNEKYVKKSRKTRKAEWQKEPNDRRVGIPAAGNEILFGIAPCWMALQQKRRILHNMSISPSFQKSDRHEVRSILAAVDNQVEIKVVHRNELDRLSGGRPHQGVCLESSPLEYYTLSDREDVLNAQLEAIQPSSCAQHPPVWLALDQVKDPMNLGAVLRSSYFLGVDKVITCVQNSCPLSPVVSKASSGVMEILEVYAAVNMPIFLQCMVSLGWQVIGAYSSTNAVRGGNVHCVPCQEFAVTHPTVLVIGNEGYGIRPQVEDTCSKFLTIQPGRELHPGIDSLNVSVATGILLHSLLRKEE